MPPIRKFTKEDIINFAFQIAKNEGLAAINARRVGKELNSSVQPIYYYFDNIDDLKNSVLKKMTNYFCEYLITDIRTDMPEYKQIGIKYIKFAKTEPQIFVELFIKRHEINFEKLELNDSETLKIIQTFANKSTNLDQTAIKDFHFKIWIFTHGLATIVSSGNYNINDEQIAELLSSEFQALMLLKDNPDNKYNITKWKKEN